MKEMNLLAAMTISNDAKLVTFTYRLIAETDKLQSFPEAGRVVPEYG